MPPEPIPLTAPEQVRRGKAERGSKQSRSPKLVPMNPEAGLVWHGPEYPVLEPGRYMVRGTAIQGPVFVRSFQRWSCRVEFALVDEPISVSAFFNFGNEKHGPKIARQSRFYKAWVLANGDHPRRGQKMSPDIFLEGQFFEVEVQACNRDSEGNPKPQAEEYSRVTRILSMRLV